MTSQNTNIEKININKERKAWNETLNLKGKKLNKTKRDRSTKRAFCEFTADQE